jgi:hypothetical protein|tara:strand:- start:980 stop:1636 length:657 start_codon:yes stop_codon:yes gene_type:complete
MEDKKIIEKEDKKIIEKEDKKIIEKTVSIQNFMGVYDNYITEQECNRAIELFEQEDKLNRTLNRQLGEQAPVSRKQDQQFFASGRNIEIWHDALRLLIANFDIAFKHYAENTGVYSYVSSDLFYTSLKIQKTLPTEGYHVWHIEHGKGFDNEARVLVYVIYLNDVEEGGETEFLYFSKRVKPKKGRIVIFPATFPYVHRGNPPISGEKYILTSWLNLR